MTSSDKSTIHEIKRLEALIDGVFAIAMTILVLGIEIPKNTGSLSGFDLHKAIIDQSSQIVAYIISFLMLGLFWTINNIQFKSFIKTDGKHVWLTIIMLIFICLVPYSASLKGNFPNDWMSNLYFNINMFAISVIYLINWDYATKNNRLTDKEFTLSHRKRGIARNMIFVVITIIAAASSFFIYDYSAYCYFLVPLLKFAHEKLVNKPKVKTS